MNDRSRNQFHMVQPLRLCAWAPVDWEVLDDPVLRDAVHAAQTCAAVRASGQRLPNVTATGVNIQPLREAVSLVGSIGEGLVASVGCEVEIEAHRRLESAERAQLESSRRFFAIAEGQELLGIGHRMLNAAVRAFATSPELEPDLAVEFRGWSKAYRPFDLRNRAAWLALTKQNADCLNKIAQTSAHHSLRKCGHIVQSLQASTSWRELDEMRGEVFHRARPESSVSFGVDAESGYISPLMNDDGEQIGEAVTEADPYTAGDGREQLETAVAGQALATISSASEAIALAVAASIEPLTEGRHIFDRSSLSVSRIFGRPPWDPAKCSCCTGDP